MKLHQYSMKEEIHKSIGSFFSHARSCGQSTRNKNNGKVDNELNYNQTQITDKPYSSVKIIVQ